MSASTVVLPRAAVSSEAAAHSAWSRRTQRELSVSHGESVSSRGSPWI